MIGLTDGGAWRGGYAAAVAKTRLDALLVGRGLFESRSRAAAAVLAGEARVLRLGLPDRYVTHGKPALLREEVGLDPESIADRVAEAVLEPTGALA